MSLKSWAALAAIIIASPVQAQPELEEGFAGALRGCEAWVLDPASWANGADAFVKEVGLGGKMALVASVDEASLPPAQLRIANHYWRINSTADSGYVLVVSDQLPMCHITGGGQADLQPAIEAVLASSEFQGNWEKGAERRRGEMISTMFKNRKEPKFEMTISRAGKPGLRRDRVQVLATGTYEVGK
jgi:hypothetical protein